ncbi:Hypp564 [Branchiostoma lanceolatum]|uniref:Hypp564 protein n=1 Tax=Branchiostoma lanceolatum TaxID=7740 RepID=A0A8J9VBB3_BRALA|nr:Hypp564 [Branchiostoma lanceolatum]
MHAESEDEKTPLLTDPRYPESGGVRRREEGATAKSEEDEEGETKNSLEWEGAEGFDDGIGGKKRKPWQKLRGKNKRKEIQAVPEVIISNPKARPTIEDLQHEVEKAQDIARNNVQKLVNRQDQQLQDVLVKSEELLAAANDFAKVSRCVKLKAWLRSKKWTICVIFIVVLILGVIGIVVGVLYSPTVHHMSTTTQPPSISEVEESG